MACHRQLQPSAKSCAMNRHHYRLSAVFNAEEERKKSGAARFARSHLAEFFDVSSRNKRPSAADKDRSFHGGIVANLLDGLRNSLRHSGAKGIHRRIVDGDDGDIVLVSAEPYQIAHRELRSLRGAVQLPHRRPAAAAHNSVLNVSDAHPYFFRSSFFNTFPVAVFDKVSQNSIERGHL